MTLLLAGAFGPEIAPFIEHLPADVLARAVGIGLVDAGLGALVAIRETSARGVVFVGTCGAFEGAGLTIGDVVVLRDTVIADAASARGEGHLLPTLAAPIEGNLALGLALAPGARPVRVATVLAVTTDDATATVIARAAGAQVEHLEAFAVAAAAGRAGIPFTAVLGVANMVGSHGRSEWAAHHQRVSTAVRDAVLPGFATGAFRALLASAAPSTL